MDNTTRYGTELIAKVAMRENALLPKHLRMTENGTKQTFLELAVGSAFPTKAGPPILGSSILKHPATDVVWLSRKDADESCQNETSLHPCSPHTDGIQRILDQFINGLFVGFVGSKETFLNKWERLRHNDCRNVPFRIYPVVGIQNPGPALTAGRSHARHAILEP